MRQSLEDFNGQTILLTGRPGDEKAPFRNGKEIWKNCQVLSADFTNYDLFNIHYLRQKTQGQKVEIDHLWIPHGCFIAQYLPASCQSPDVFYAIGKVEKYKRKDGTEDYCIAPVELPNILDVAIQHFAWPSLCHLLVFSTKVKNPNPKNSVWINRLKTLETVTHFLKQYPSATKSNTLMRLILGRIEAEFPKIEQKFNKQQNQAKKNEKRKKGFGFSRQAIYA